MSMSEPLRSESLVSSCTRSLQNLHLPAIETTGPTRQIPPQLENSSGGGGSMDNCFIASYCSQLPPRIPIESTSYGAEMR